MLNEHQIYLFGWIKTSQTEGQPNDTDFSPLVSGISLLKLSNQIGLKHLDLPTKTYICIWSVTPLPQFIMYLSTNIMYIFCMMQMIQLLLHTSKQNSAFVTVPKTGGWGNEKSFCSVVKCVANLPMVCKTQYLYMHGSIVVRSDAVGSECHTIRCTSGLNGIMIDCRYQQTKCSWLQIAVAVATATFGKAFALKISFATFWKSMQKDQSN